MSTISHKLVLGVSGWFQTQTKYIQILMKLRSRQIKQLNTMRHKLHQYAPRLVTVVQILCAWHHWLLLCQKVLEGQDMQQLQLSLICLIICDLKLNTDIMSAVPFMVPSLNIYKMQVTITNMLRCVLVFFTLPFSSCCSKMVNISYNLHFFTCFMLPQVTALLKWLYIFHTTRYMFTLHQV